jgi:TRAP-type C4-dicarboxylate transport system substrate-binding protein
MNGNARTHFVTLCTVLSLVGMLCLGVFAAEVAAAEKKMFHWKFSSHTAPGNKSVGFSQSWWAEQVEKRSNGQIRIKMYWVDELCGPKEMMMAVKSRLADVVGQMPSYTPGETPILNATYLPFVSAPRLDQSVMVYNRVAKESKPFIDEMSKFNCIYAGAYEDEGYNLIGKKAVRTVNDLKGLRIRCMPDLGLVLKIFGAIPVTVPVTEMYSSLDTGIVDVIAQARSAFRAYKLDELSKYITLSLDMGCSPNIYLINREAWNELPDDLKKVVQSVIDDTPAFMWDFQHRPDRLAEGGKVVKERGIEVIHFPKPERAKLVAQAESIWEAWAKRSGNYEVAKQALAEYIRIRDEVVAKYPEGAPGIMYK